jgi:hypothetical protein
MWTPDPTSMAREHRNDVTLAGRSGHSLLPPAQSAGARFYPKIRVNPPDPPADRGDDSMALDSSYRLVQLIP